MNVNIPTAIVIAGALIAGSIFFTGGIQIGETDAAPKTGTIQYTVDDIKQWAGKVRGLDKKNFVACLDSGETAAHVTAQGEAGSEYGVQGTPSFFLNGVLLEPTGAQPFAFFRDAIENALLGPASSRTQTGKQIDLKLTADEHAMGSADAPLTLVEYSDFQCPFCRRFFNETLSEIKKNYIDTGRVRLVYRHYPLPFHDAAQKSAEATECAAKQGKFWEMHDAIFIQQAK